MQEYVEAGIRSGILEKSISPYGSMALIVKKKDGTPRVVIDYRALNEVTKKNSYPLPLMDELFDRTAGAKFFTSIDLRNGFHQIAIRPEDKREDCVPHALWSLPIHRFTDGTLQRSGHASCS